MRISASIVNTILNICINEITYHGKLTISKPTLVMIDKFTKKMLKNPKFQIQSATEEERKFFLDFVGFIGGGYVEEDSTIYVAKKTHNNIRSLIQTIIHEFTHHLQHQFLPAKEYFEINRSYFECSIEKEAEQFESIYGDLIFNKLINIFPQYKDK